MVNFQPKGHDQAVDSPEKAEADFDLPEDPEPSYDTDSPRILKGVNTGFVPNPQLVAEGEILTKDIERITVLVNIIRHAGTGIRSARTAERANPRSFKSRA